MTWMIFCWSDVLQVQFILSAHKSVDNSAVPALSDPEPVPESEPADMDTVPESDLSYVAEFELSRCSDCYQVNSCWIAP